MLALQESGCYPWLLASGLVCIGALGRGHAGPITACIAEVSSVRQILPRMHSYQAGKKGRWRDPLTWSGLENPGQYSDPVK